VGLAVVVFAGVGWYQGWYTFKTEATGPGHRQFNVNVDTNKIEADLEKGEKKVHDALSKGQGPTSAQTAPAQNANVPAQTTGAKGSSLTVNSDGSISYQGNMQLPKLVPNNGNPQ
jgi:hypothetical protein